MHRFPQSAGLVLQWLDESSGRTWRKLPLLGQVEPLIEVVQMLESEPSQLLQTADLGEAKAESLRRWKGTKWELMEVFQMISDIAGSSALPSRSRQVVGEEMREKHWVSTFGIPEPPGKTSAQLSTNIERDVVPLMVFSKQA